MDRTKSGNVSFSKDFPCTTFAPIAASKLHTIRLFFDKSGIEIFGDDSHFAMTNLVFPSEPYNQLDFIAKQGSFKIKTLNVYKLQ
jgi:fructan beta-fructosidase